MTEVQVSDAPREHRFEARTPEGVVVAYAMYQVSDGTVVFTHTETDPRFEGQGVASTLVRAALDSVRASGRDVAAFCPYVKAWLARHPEYQDLVHPVKS